MYKVLCIVGNRPQFVKQAMFDQALKRLGSDAGLTSVTVNTGQHYDRLMSDVFIQELGANEPAYDLGIGSGPILDQIGKMLQPLREILAKEEPDVVLLYGDTNSTLAGALSAAHSGIPCVHVEAGERLYRRDQVPEEINRVAADHLCDLLLTCSRKASRYLLREGIGGDRMKYVGDPMLDLFSSSSAQVDSIANAFPADYGFEANSFILATLHRVENTAERETLIGLLSALDDAPIPVLLPAHPRIKHLLEDWDWAPQANLRLIEPLGYYDLLALLRDAALIVSDSGGLTREALFAGKGCIVPLDSCWWTEAVEAGLAIAVGQDTDALRKALSEYRPDTRKAPEIVEREFGDGTAAENIVAELRSFLDGRIATGRSESAWHQIGFFDELPKTTSRTDFSYAAYRAMLASLKGANYTFTPFEVPESKSSTVCLLRHDIDFDLEKALEMAVLEHEEGVSATYFFMLSSDHYNLGSKRSRGLVTQILGLGHYLGLHFDAEAYPELATPAAYSDKIAQECEVLARFAGEPVSAVSFHRPSPLILEGESELSSPLLHSYDHRLAQLAEYAADSSGAWKHGHPLDRTAFERREALHILVHPVWWSDNPNTAFETLLSLIDRRRQTDLANFAANCRSFRVGELGRMTEFPD